MPSLKEFTSELSLQPHYDRYLSVDELDRNSETLANDNTNAVKLLKLGKTKKGHQLLALKIGNGTHNALVYGCSNPEEPIGGVALDYFSHALTADERLLRELDYTWYIITCIDPDGARLTEGYLKGPFTPYNLALNYYRTPLSETGEDNFPYRYGDILDLNKPTPETISLMQILEGRKFDFVSSLHAMWLAGMTFQVSEPCAQIYGPLEQLAKTNGIAVGRRVFPWGEVAPGVQLASWMTPATNYVRLKMQGKQPLQPLTGAFVLEFARLANPHVFMMIPECGAWFDPRIHDERPSGSTLKDAREYRSILDKATNELVLDTYKALQPQLSVHSPFRTVLEDQIEEISHPTLSVIQPDLELTTEHLNREITVAQKLELEAELHIDRLFRIGLIIRTIEYEIQHGAGSDELSHTGQDLRTQLEADNKRMNSLFDIRHYDFGKLITTIAGSLLFASQYAKNSNIPPQLWY